MWDNCFRSTCINVEYVYLIGTDGFGMVGAWLLVPDGATGIYSVVSVCIDTGFDMVEPWFLLLPLFMFV